MTTLEAKAMAGKADTEQLVLVSRHGGGSRYHSTLQCRELRKNAGKTQVGTANYSPVTVEQAVAEGYLKCRYCVKELRGYRFVEVRDDLLIRLHAYYTSVGVDLGLGQPAEDIANVNAAVERHLMEHNA